MNDLMLLLKASLINNFSLNKIFKKQIKKGSFIGAIIVGTLVVLGVFGFSFFYMLMFGSLFNEAGIPEAILTLAISLGSVMCFMSTIFQANSYLFRTKDFELLMSTPIKPRTIVASKLISLFLTSYAFIAMIYIPCIIVYAIFLPTTLTFWLLAIVVLLLLPIVPVIAGSLVAYLLGFIPIPHKLKNTLSIILSVAFISIVFIFGFNTGDSEEEMINMMIRMYETLKKAYFLSDIVFFSLMGNLINLLIYVGISAISLLAFIIVVSKTFLLANSANKIHRAHKHFDNKLMEKTKQSSALMAIFKKEIKVYLGIPGYVLNTIIGPIMSIIFLLSYILSAEDIISTPETLVKIQELNVIMLLIMVGLSTTMTTTTSSAISIEGKSFWILKAAPVKTKDVLTAKLLVSLIILLPVIVIEVIVASIFWHLSPLIVLVVLLCGISQCLSFSSLGLLINIIFPRFDYDNPIKVIKQGKSVLLIMIISLLVFGFLSVVTFILATIIGIIAIVVNLVLSMLLAIISVSLLYTKGEAKYDAINV